MIRVLKNKLLGAIGIKEKYFSARKKIRDYSKEINTNKTYAYSDELTIVIPSLNRLDVLKDTLNNLINYKTNLRFKILIIDNNSNLKTLNYLKSLRHQYIEVIFSKENLGGAGSREISLKEVTTELVCFLDNDIIVMPYYFEALIDCLKRSPKIVGVQSKVIFPNLKIQINNPNYTIKDDLIIFEDLDEEKTFNDTSTEEAHSINWSPIGATMWRTEVIKKYKFDLLFGTSYEDNDLTYRITKDGNLIFNCPNALCIHFNSLFTPSSNDETYTKGRYNQEQVIKSARRFFEKHGYYLIYKDVKGYLEYINVPNLKTYKELINLQN